MICGAAKLGHLVTFDRSDSESIDCPTGYLARWLAGWLADCVREPAFCWGAFASANPISFLFFAVHCSLPTSTAAISRSSE